MKMSKDSSGKYYEKDKKNNLKAFSQSYKNLSKEEDKANQQYGGEQYKNFPED